MFFLPHNLTEYYWLLAGIYLANTAVMAALVPHLIATWSRSFSKRSRPSVFLRWRSMCPAGVNTYGFALLQPDNGQKRDLWLNSVFPLLNTVLLLFFIVVVPCVMARNLFVSLLYGSEANYQRWLRSY